MSIIIAGCELPKQLIGLRVDEVSLVDEPANPGAKVAFFKRKEPSKMSKFMAWVTKHLGEDAAEELSEIKAEEDTTEFKAALEEEQVETTGSGDSAGDGSAIAGKNKTNKGDEEMNPEELKKSIDAAVAEAIAKSKAETSEAIAKAKAEADEAISKAKAEAAADVAKANDALAKMAEQRADEARLAKAKTLVDGVTGFTAEQVAGMLKSMDEKQAEEFEKSLKVLKSTSKTSKLFAEAGVAVGKSGTAYQQLEAKAAELMAADKKLTKSVAMKRVTKSNPELYAQYRSEQN